MHRILKLSLTVALTISSFVASAQCIGSSQSPSGVVNAPASGVTSTAYSVYPGSYSRWYSVAVGPQYTMTSSNSADYFTVRSGTSNGTLVAFGQTPLRWTANISGIHFISINSNSTCSTSGSSRNITLSTTGGSGCSSGSLNPSASYTPSCTGTPQAIITGASYGFSNVILTNGVPYTFTSSMGADQLTITNSTGGTKYVWGTSPLTFVPATSGTYRFFTHSNSTCGTTGTRTRSISCPTGGGVGACLSGTQYPASTFTPSCTGSNEYITGAANYGEFTMMALTNGTAYTFTCSNGGYVTLGNSAGTVEMASGPSPFTWTATSSGNYRYYIHEDINCGSGGVAGVRYIKCGTAVPIPSCAIGAVPTNGSSACFASTSTLLSWNSTASATGYDVYFNSGVSATTLVSNNQTGTSYNASTPSQGSYSWRIVPRNSTGSATGCATWSFTRTTPPTWYADSDGDGFGDPSVLIIDCAQPTGYIADNSDCDDTQFLYADTDGDGYGAGAPVACGVPNNADDCPTVFGVIGGACDAGPGSVFGQLNASCNCIGVQCTTDLSLDITMPVFGTLPTWELREDATDILVQNGGGGFANPGINQQNTCLPDGNFRLIMNGVPIGGSYVLRTTGNPGTRIIDNITTVAGTTSVTAFSTTPAALSSNGAVQVPVGQTDLLFTNCDKPFWKSGEYVVCNEHAVVAAEWVLNGANTVQSSTTGYDFWFYDPNGGYSYIRQRRHNVSDNFANIGSSRTCHMKVNNWATANHIPDGVKLNVRVRAVVNNVPGNWGPACRFVRDEALAACPPTKLFDLQGSPQFYSCNVTRAFIPNAANRLYARPVSGANKYKFTITSAELATPIVKVVNTYYLTLGWTSGPTMNVGETYDVTVQASFNNGASYCVIGDACYVSIISNAVGGQQSFALDGGSALNMWPNPNNGEVLNMSLHIADPFISTVSMDIFDLSGKCMIARTMAIQNGVLNTTIDLNGDPAVGMYMVKVTAGDEVFTKRVVIQK